MNQRITFDEACSVWVNGGTFDDFVRDTSDYTRKYAERSARKMRLPECVQVGDIIQEFYMRAWQAGTAYDASRGTSPGKYILMGAYRNANVWLHKQRGAAARDVRSPSRHAVPFSALPAMRGESDEYGSIDEVLDIVSTDPDAEDLAAARECVQQTLDKLSPKNAELLLAFLKRGGHAKDGLGRRRLRRVMSNILGSNADA